MTTQFDFTAADINALVVKLNKMTLVEYALRFGGLIVSDDRLIAYKAEYLAKLMRLAEEVA